MSNFIMSYSSGKDSTLALYRLIKKGHKPIALLITLDRENSRSWFHGVPENLLEEVSLSLNIPLFKVYNDFSNYESTFEEALIKGKNMGADFCAFGDIDIEEHIKWCTDRCNKVSLGAEFPLWKEDREALTKEFIDSGFSAVIKIVQLKYLSTDFLGKTLTKEIVEDIKVTGADPCGENGEYHTFVYDGPIFDKKVDFNVHGVETTETHGFLKLFKE